ncbi:MAG: tRNA uridine-5-carboxymethylaminomethyl(34) synthesis GTPase MnmE [Rhizobiaceae bacterium]|nr:tRNA uridine-5-carboxymethylaminomethyl(34) synthesis GTPase MnmE [Rhizobiaceae bacterium]
MQFADTIYALSSGRPPAGVAVVRLSGQQARAVASALAGSVPPPRVATLMGLTSGDRALDRAIVLFFAAPHSFTGEDCLELHLHGGASVVAAVLEAVAAIDGVRMAEPGEFTRRAYLNGKMDLAAAEALGDLIAAETEAQRLFALTSAEGRQSMLYASWRARVIHALAMIEAELDFADEGDVPGSVAKAVWTDIAGLVDDISVHLDGFARAEIIREGFRVVIVGPPNAGKSSLLNALARREVAIVTAEPGTTRDLVEVSLDLAGIKVILTDTAGLRETTNAAEAIGIRKALTAARDANLVVWLVPPETGDATIETDRAMLKVMSKSDLHPSRAIPVGFDGAISTVSGGGVDWLIGMIEKRARDSVGTTTGLLPARQRHVGLLRQARSHLEGALGHVGLELRAEELRLAAGSIGRIAGHVDVEDVLDAVFSSFCIGK